jgi:hypothetical protein
MVKLMIDNLLIGVGLIITLIGVLGILYQDHTRITCKKELASSTRTVEEIERICK